MVSHCQARVTGKLAKVEDIPVLCGSIIPAGDIPAFKKAGMA
jgi:methylmalonyl-CoA mutase cobalamin-binding subunit